MIKVIAQDLLSVTEDEFDIQEQKAKAHFETLRSILSIGFCAIVAVVVIQVPDKYVDATAGVWAVFAWLWFADLLRQHVNPGKYYNLLSTSDDQCMEALALIRTSAAAKQYRDAVLAKGRQLRYADLLILRELGSGNITVLEPSDRKTACQQLHHLA